MGQASNDARFAEKTPPLFLRPDAQQDEQIEVIESSEDYVGAAVDKHGFIATAYTCVYI